MNAGASRFSERRASQRGSGQLRTGGAVARADKPAAIGPMQAAGLKAEPGRAVLLLDLRSHIEAAFGGHLARGDALAPYAEVAQPPRRDAATVSLALEPAPQFAQPTLATVAVLGGDRDTPLLLVCRTGAIAEQAAAVLRAQGFKYVMVVQGGLDGAQFEDGPQQSGWKATGLPWLAQADPVVPFGDAE